MLLYVILKAGGTDRVDGTHMTLVRPTEMDLKSKMTSVTRSSDSSAYVLNEEVSSAFTAMSRHQTTQLTWTPTGDKSLSLAEAYQVIVKGRFADTDMEAFQTKLEDVFSSMSGG